MKKPDKKKFKQAVSIEYSANYKAPKITAKGGGLVAEKIIEIAKKNNIPIKEDADLLKLLMVLDVEEFIPPALYNVVAELLAFVYNLNKKKGDAEKK